MRAKGAAANLGKKMSSKLQAKLRATHLGKKMSPEAVARSVATKRANRAAKLLGS